MIERLPDHEDGTCENERGCVSGLLVGTRQVWVLVAGSDAHLRDERADTEQGEIVAPLRICRAVLEDGTLLVGDPDPDQDLLMTELLENDCCGTA